MQPGVLGVSSTVGLIPHRQEFEQDNFPNLVEPEVNDGKRVIAGGYPPAYKQHTPAPMPAIVMPIDIGPILARVSAVERIVKEVMKPEIHYGLPYQGGATQGARMVLKKPGIDVMCLAFQFRIDYIEAPGTVRCDAFINIAYRANVYHTPTGNLVASAYGSANSKEEKYRWARGSGKPACPSCGVDAVWASKDTAKPGFFCWGKKGGCGQKFEADDTRITSQKPTKTENDNAWEFLNMLEKIAQKRAGMAAIINACGLSNHFDQDIPTADEGRAGLGDEDSPPAAVIAMIKARAEACKGLADFRALYEELKAQGWPALGPHTRPAMDEVFLKKWPEGCEVPE
jgi:hypothetical protein